MNHQQAMQRLYELSVQAGMNQRYHQIYSSWWWGWDTFMKVTTAALSVVGAMLAVTSLYAATPPVWDQLSLGLAVISAIVAVALNVVPFGNWEKDHRDHMRQWFDFREDVDSIRLGCQHDQTCVPFEEIKKLDGKMHRICSQEPSPNTRVIKECYDAEERSRKPASLTQSQPLTFWQWWQSRKRAA